MTRKQKLGWILLACATASLFATEFLSWVFALHHTLQNNFSLLCGTSLISLVLMIIAAVLLPTPPKNQHEKADPIQTTTDH